MKPRHHLYLDDDLTAQLDALSAVPGTSKSAIVADALRQYLKHRGGTEQDDAVRVRLDRLSRHHERMERDLAIVIETLTEFLRTYIAATSFAPDLDNAARAKANEKLRAFIARVAAGLASGKPSIVVHALNEAVRGEQQEG